MVSAPPSQIASPKQLVLIAAPLHPFEDILNDKHTNRIYIAPVVPVGGGWPVHGFISRHIHDIGFKAMIYGHMPFLMQTFLGTSYDTQGYDGWIWSPVTEEY